MCGEASGEPGGRGLLITVCLGLALGLAQVMAIFAMEDPVSLDAEDIRNEKVPWPGRLGPVV